MAKYFSNKLIISGLYTDSVSKSMYKFCIFAEKKSFYRCGMNSVSVNIFLNITHLFADINEPESRMSSTLIIQFLLNPEDKTSFKINIGGPYLSFPQSQHLAPVRSTSVLAQKFKLIE